MSRIGPVKKRRRLWLRDPRCQRCGVVTVLPETLPMREEKNRPGHKNIVGRIPDNMATLQHIDSRYSKERGRHEGEIRVVLYCHACNGKDAREVQALVPRRELWRRSGQDDLLSSERVPGVYTPHTQKGVSR